MRKIALYICAALLVAATLPLRAADQMTRYNPRSGSELRVEGTSNVHDWRAMAKLILGYLEVGPGFPTKPGDDVKPGKIEARGQAFIETQMLKSKTENWTNSFNSTMDENILKGLKAGTPSGSHIVFHLTELTLKEVPKSKDAPYLFDSKGDLAIAGVTNKVSLPLSITFVPTPKETRIKISGSTPVKRSDYSVKPETFLEKLGFSVGDEVKVSFDWMLGPQAPAAAAAAKK